MKRQENQHPNLRQFAVPSNLAPADGSRVPERYGDNDDATVPSHWADAGKPAHGASPVIPTWKLLLDIVLVLLALPFLAPIMAIVSVLIKVVSPGPVFFRQERVGLGGKHFQCIKFRSMRTDADPAVHAAYVSGLQSTGAAMEKMDARKDKRLIRWGALLRASALDELPQIWNVVRGEMSWIGPRPCIPYELEKYQPWHYERFNSLPGLTGWWQVKGKNRTTFDEMVRLDIEYTQRRSLFLDLYILLRTPFVIIRQVFESVRGARKAKEAVPAEETDAKEVNPCTAPDLSLPTCIKSNSYEASG